MEGKTPEEIEHILKYTAKAHGVEIDTKKKTKIDGESQVLIALKEYMKISKKQTTAKNKQGGGRPFENI